jgi:hypothetical protein
MQYDGFAWAVVLLAVLALLVALRILLRAGWFLGWLRGTCGFLFLALAGLVGLVAYDLYGYSTLPRDKPLATLGFKADGPGRYQVTLLEGAQERTLTLEGDMWQLDGRLIRWKGLANLIGLEPGYRLERLSGRFLSIEQQALAQHGRVALAESPYGVDLWRWLRLSRRDLALFDPQALRVSYLPIAADAVYSVHLTPTGLLAEPMNSAAEAALKNWR